ncbi:CdaR family protein [Cohnella abietis]|uniref:CdaA regulatory protein CdaR n=1 Tax=Cohnella abietis TaxID=2507935 RepID=A0A3T1DCU6_9BACL|nr:CdaR family protein [Cohnella abietis]BBI35981.1 hypothetical protein KCTCHS21_53800 [Cohnella abietis]
MDKWLNHPTAAKLAALFLAILIWAVVHFDPADSSPNSVSSLLETSKYTVKVQTLGLDERNYKLLDISPQSVNLKVKGTRRDFILSKPEDFVVQVDLRTVTEGKHTMELKVELPRGLEEIEVSPRTVTVTIEALLTKEFEVSILTSGNPAKGFKVGTPIVKPSNRVHVTLPELDIDKVDRIGASISVEGEKSTIKDKSVKLAAYDKNGKVIENAVIDPAVLEVEIPITNPFKTVPLKFKLLGHMPPGSSISSFKPDVEQVTVYGPQDALDKIEFINVDIKLDEVKSSGKVSIPLEFSAPIIEISPKQIDINIEVLLSGTRSLEGLPITWTGLGDGLTVKITEPSNGKADITIQGAPAILDRLKPGDVDVIADLSGRGPGIYRIPLIVNLERFMEQVGGTNSITVEIIGDVPASANPGEEVPGDGVVDEGAAGGTGTEGPVDGQPSP